VLYGALQNQYRKQIGGGQALTPQYEFENEVGRKVLDVNVLFIWGAHDPMYVKDDLKAFEKSFARGKAMFEIFPNSSRTPWAEEPPLFYEKFDKLVEQSGSPQGKEGLSRVPCSFARDRPAVKSAGLALAEIRSHEPQRHCAN
jgi:hypothetical protein